MAKLNRDALEAVRELTVAGLTARKIAAELGLSERSVTTARGRLRAEGRLPTPPDPKEAARALAAAQETTPAGSVTEVLADPRFESSMFRLLVRSAQAGSVPAIRLLLERSAPERWAPGAEPLPPVPAADDPFAKVDELAAQRRRRRS